MSLCDVVKMKINTTSHLDTASLAEAYRAGTSSFKLARDNGVSLWAVLKRLREAGVEIRPDGVRKTLNLSAESSQVLRELVDGLLLGDGSICKAKPSLRLEQSRKRDGWITDLQDQLAAIGVTSNTTEIPPVTKILMGRSVTKDWSRVLYTPVCEEMRAERLRWYPDGVKRVPSDLKLTPLTIAMWFAGDGTYDAQGALFFCTNSFLRHEVVRLADELTVLDVRAYMAPVPGRDRQYKVSVTRRNDAQRLKEIIVPHLPSCCMYKLQHVRPTLRGGSK